LIFLPKKKTHCSWRKNHALSLNLDCLRISLNQKNSVLCKAVDAFVNERNFDIEVRFDITWSIKKATLCNWAPWCVLSFFYYCCYICNKLFFLFTFVAFIWYTQTSTWTTK
jgi:hypothetical protein